MNKLTCCVAVAVAGVGGVIDNERRTTMHHRTITAEDGE